ncbi:MAG TPA: hypothetical protein VMA13_04150 [Candidatus Saccharimonadales bacterium]|nr:hypothetical protein [Candidatus Saccharimonadales bacterium]
MDENANPGNFPRQFASILLGAAIAAAGLWLCRWLVLHGGIFGSIGVSVLPAVVGLIAGLAMRHVCAEGSFNLASAGIVLVLVFGLACAAVRHKVLFDERLKQEADATYDATRTYAQNIVPVAGDDAALRHFMFTNHISVIGRITPVEDGDPDDYWKARNLIHLHWVATSRVITYRQLDVDRTIADASSVLGDNIFLNKIVAQISGDNPVTDDDLSRFRQHELPYLRLMNEGKISACDFEKPLIQEVRSHVNWQTFAFNGFDPFLLIAMLWGSFFIYKLARQPDEMENV